jgi:SET domain-containing protein
MRIEVRASAIQGLGIFASVNISAGETIHVLAYEREITAEAPLRPEAGERAEHCAYPNGSVMLVAYPYRHMNHSCDPNAYYADENGRTVARARRDIAAGTEITVDYLINNPGGTSWPCHCGAARCRGTTGTSFFALPIELRREYAPLLAPWFQEKFAEQLRDT